MFTLTVLVALQLVMVVCCWENNGNFSALSRCRRGTYSLLDQFLRDRWNDARREVNLQPIVWDNYNASLYRKKDFVRDKVVRKVPHTLTQQFRNVMGFSSRCFGWDVNETMVLYIQIWKCGTVGIIQNMDDFAHAYGGLHNERVILKSFSIDDFKAAVKNQQNLSSFQYQPISKQFRNRHDLKIFTFVREPMSHFESGLLEAGWRTYLYNNSIRRKKNFVFQMQSVDEVKAFIHEILNLNVSTLTNIEHAYPQAGVFFNTELEVFGEIEHFLAHWKSRIEPQFHFTTPYDATHGRHQTSVNHPYGTLFEQNATSKDPNNLRKYYRLLLETRPEYVRALCNMLLVDYICLPQYPLPTECSHLQIIREQGYALLA